MCTESVVFSLPMYVQLRPAGSVAEFGGRAEPVADFAAFTAGYEGYEMAGEENNVPTGSEMSSPPSSSKIASSIFLKENHHLLHHNFHARMTG